MRKIKFKDILPKALDIDLAIQLLKQNGAIEIGKIEGKKDFVVLDEDGQPISQKETLETIKYQYMATILIKYFDDHASKGDMAEIDLENEQLIIYEHDKDKEIIDSLPHNFKGSKERESAYIS